MHCVTNVRGIFLEGLLSITLGFSTVNRSVDVILYQTKNSLWKKKKDKSEEKKREENRSKLRMRPARFPSHRSIETGTDDRGGEDRTISSAACLRYLLFSTAITGYTVVSGARVTCEFLFWRPACNKSQASVTYTRVHSIVPPRWFAFSCTGTTFICCQSDF